MKILLGMLLAVVLAVAAAIAVVVTGSFDTSAVKPPSNEARSSTGISIGVVQRSLHCPPKKSRVSHDAR